jgi:hypothetical protein
VQVGLIAHGYHPGPSGKRYLLKSDAFAATSKAARNLVNLIDLYPIEKCIGHLRAFVVEEKDNGTPLSQVHEYLRQKVLQFLRSFASQGIWEAVMSDRGIDLSDGRPFTKVVEAILTQPAFCVATGLGDILAQIDPPEIRSDSARSARVAENAYFRWLDEGRPDDRQLQHWLDAEREYICTTILRGRRLDSFGSNRQSDDDEEKAG